MSLGDLFQRNTNNRDYIWSIVVIVSFFIFSLCIYRIKRNNADSFMCILICVLMLFWGLGNIILIFNYLIFMITLIISFINFIFLLFFFLSLPPFFIKIVFSNSFNTFYAILPFFFFNLLSIILILLHLITPILSPLLILSLSLSPLSFLLLHIKQLDLLILLKNNLQIINR